MKHNGYDEKTYILANEVNIPVIGFGTGVIKRFYLNKPMYVKDKLKSIMRSVRHMKINRTLKNDYTIPKTLDTAVHSGYRLFDSGRLYGHSEYYIGKVISKYNRNDFFITTKVCADDLKRYPNAYTVHDNLSISLKNLQTSYIDAYLLHFPEPNKISMYHEIENEYKLKRCKSIGVCNFDIQELRELMNHCEIMPMINQVELHPLNQKTELRRFCQEHNIIVMAHTPTAGSYIRQISQTDIMKHLSDKYKKSIVQIIYRWHVQNGVIPIVSSISKKHLVSDLDIFDFMLTKDEMKEIEALNEDKVLCMYNSKKSDVPDFIYNF